MYSKRRAQRCSIFFLFLVFILAVSGAGYPKTIGWHISGENTLRFDHYEVRGDKSQSPYRFEGIQGYDEFSINMTKREGLYRLWRIQVAGLMSDSDYRGHDNGFVPERLNIFHERGDWMVPFRLEAGDIYGYLSYRTLQVSLKGLQMEFQPFVSANTIHSILLISGAKQPEWRHLDLKEDLITGLSYLVEDRFWGRWSLNVIHNSRASDEEAGLPYRSSYTYGLALEKGFNIKGESIDIEVELTEFSGDNLNGSERDEAAIFAQISGRGRLPYSYRLRFEQYGQDYQPAGAAVRSGRKSGAVDAGWDFRNGLGARLRYERTRTAYELANPVDTDVYGFYLHGPIPAGFAMNLSATLQNVSDRERTLDQDSWTVNMDLTKNLGGMWLGRVGVFVNNLDNHIAALEDIWTSQVTLGLTHPLEIAGFRGMASGGVGIRYIDGGGESFDIFPTFSTFLKRGSHSISYSLSYNSQDRRSVTGEDVRTLRNAFSYNYTKGRHVVGFEVADEYRDGSAGGWTDSLRVGLFWKFLFDRPAEAATIETGEEEVVSEAGGLIITTLTPGISIDRALEITAEAGMAGKVEGPGYYIYEARVFRDVFNRQRLVIEHSRGLVERTSLIVDIDDGERPSDIARTYENMKETLIRLYGKPLRFEEKGKFSPALQEDLNGGKFVRIMDWKVGRGVLRLGIPRRLDGRVRIEVQYAESVPPLDITMWGIEGIR
jgi:hypothetical protein